MGTRKKRERQEDFWYGGELARAPGHPFYYVTEFGELATYSGKFANTERL